MTPSGPAYTPEDLHRMLSAAVDAATEAAAEGLPAARAPGPPEVAFGVVAGGRLVHAHAGDRVYRIASMTKSFTAASVLGLRDELIPAHRELNLDSALARYLPELSPPALRRLTVRDALTMSTGLPTDDPWADRLESLDPEGFTRLLGMPPITTAPGGTAYEYSNYNYALLGRLIENLTGRPYPEVVTAELLEPLGMNSSEFDHRLVDRDRLVSGYRRSEHGHYIEEPFTAPGAFSPIGGLLTTVEDLARWLATLMGAATTSTAEDGWSRIYRDMQQAQRFHELRQRDGMCASEGYGYGLHHRHDSRYGEIVYHSGGYPGFGSHMRWHPRTGVGVLVLGNVTYFDAEGIAASALTEYLAATARGLRRSAAPAPAKAGDPVAPHPASARVRETMREVEGLIRTWDENTADRIFSSNMNLDLPRAERRLQFGRALAATGEAAATEWPEITMLSATQAWWQVRGPRGLRTVKAATDPFGKIQSIKLTTQSMEPEKPAAAE